MGTASSAVLPEDQAPQSFVSRVVGVFFSPGETFADIVRKPDFLAPLVLGILSTIAFSEIMLAKIGIERIIRNQIANSSRGASMTPEQIDAAVSQGAKIGTIFTHLVGFLAVPIILLIIAGVGLAIVNVIFGARAKFSTAFSVTAYANLVGVLGGLVGIAVMLFGDPDHFNAAAPVPTSLAFFLDQAHTSKALFSLATSLDLFTFWLMALLGVGFSAVTGGKAKPLSVFFAFFGVWAVYVLAKVGLAAM
ncbi:MAG TPA: YIP1 family protein [Terriglobales bacterium]